MILAITILDGTQSEISKATTAIESVADGHVKVGPRHWFVATSLEPRNWRDIVHANGPSLGFVVSKLSGTWVSWAGGDVPDWLKTHRGWF